uniref:DUF6535 domain-containing protein n=1 Tax=Moniliophthora roreri TaxID=221103 RepID=A0A0W0EVW7_MONRR
MEQVPHPGTTPTTLKECTRKAASNKAKHYTVENSWETLLKKVEEYDMDHVQNWKDDIDTLLVFAGLFSAVVTAFLIESYQWLSEDAGDVTVNLLKQISQQLRDPQFVPAEPEAFQPPASSIRINCFWLLSLILALISSLLGLLCKQWLREHGRDTYISTPAKALALRQLRRDSLEVWHVPKLVAATPILLELALFLFFAGLLELSWARHLALFVVCMFSVGLGAGVYTITTFLPLLTNVYNDLTQKDLEIPPFRFICPYKSPQSWAVYRFSCMMLRQLPPAVGLAFAKRGYHWWTAITPEQNWPVSDMRVLDAFDKIPSPPLSMRYELRALEWATRMYQDSPSMHSHFQNILQSLCLHPSVTMAGILNYWTLSIWEDFTKEDVQEELSDMEKFQETRWQDSLGWYMSTSRAPSIPDPILLSHVGIQVLYWYNHWHSLVEDISTTTVHDLSVSISFFQSIGLDAAIALRFFVPFPIVAKLWSHPDPESQRESLSLIQVYKESWNAYPGPEEEGDERLAFIAALIKHLKQDHGGHRSILLTSTQGQNFIRFVNDGIIQHRLYECPEWESDTHRRSTFITEWTQATESIADLRPIPKPQPVPALVEIGEHASHGDSNTSNIRASTSWSYRH